MAVRVRVIGKLGLMQQGPEIFSESRWTTF